MVAAPKLNSHLFIVSSPERELFSVAYFQENQFFILRTDFDLITRFEFTRQQLLRVGVHIQRQVLPGEPLPQPAKLDVHDARQFRRVE
jgi:hypothetical protein